MRLRPLNERELTAVGDHKSLEQRGISTLHLFVNNRHHDYRFDDVVGADGTQEDIFTLVGKPMVNNVMQGYNACCFAYGQTGSGKTFTMHGDLAPGPDGELNSHRGLAPRVFEAVFKVTLDPIVLVLNFNSTHTSRGPFCCSVLVFESFEQGLWAKELSGHPKHQRCTSGHNCTPSWL